MVLVALRVDDVRQHEVVMEGETGRRTELLSRQIGPPFVDLHSERMLARVFAADHEESHGCGFLSGVELAPIRGSRFTTENAETTEWECGLFRESCEVWSVMEPELENMDFRFLTSLRCVRNDRGWRR